MPTSEASAIPAKRAPIGKASHWCIVINNPTEDDHIRWESLKTLDWVIQAAGQLEKGESGTPHIQGMVQTKYGRWLKQLKNHLPRANILVAENKFALANYVKKEETRIGTVAQFQKQPVKVATQKDIQRELLVFSRNICKFKYPERWEAVDGDFKAFLSQHGWIMKKDADYFLDVVVGNLIKNGYYGVEFVMANNQVRGAFKRYLTEIIIREFDAENTQD